MTKIKTTSRKGFTLIELLTVIAIIGILAAIIIPTVGAVQKKASQVQSASNMRQIATAYSNYSTGGARTRVIGQGAWTSRGRTAADASEWAAVLASNVDLNDGSLYFIGRADDAGTYDAGTGLPRIIVTESAAGVETINTDWSAANDVISYAMTVNMSANAPTSTTPLIWTKGLQSGDGTWQTTSPWATDGGHIAFMDGHVEFFEGSVDDRLVSGKGAATPNQATSSITDATDSNSSTAVVIFEELPSE